jgi:glutathione peroxidase
MRTPLCFLAALALAPACKTSARSDDTRPAASSSASAPAAASLYDLTVHRLDGTPTALSMYRGKVALLVNVASECGYTPQYEGLEKLYEELSPKGFVILGFPSNDFGEQEPGSPNDIAAFAASQYHVTFPLFEKVKTSGADVAPVYALASKVDGPPKWNFHKYVVDRKGRVLQAFTSKVKPESDELRDAIRAALNAS